eukprot:1729024-Pleurochrysis_carterae.AAC.1
MQDCRMHARSVIARENGGQRLPRGSEGPFGRAGQESAHAHAHSTRGSVHAQQPLGLRCARKHAVHARSRTHRGRGK